MSPRVVLPAVVSLLLVLAVGQAQAQFEIPDPPIVKPKGGTASAGPNQSGLTATFGVENPNANGETFSLSCLRSGAVSSCSVPGSVWVGGFSSTNVDVTYATGASGSGTVTLTAEGFGGLDNGWYDVTVVAGPVPEVDLSPYNADNQDMARCAAGCFAATYAQSTVPYVSLDTPRNVTLVYHGDRVELQPFVHVNARHSGGGTLPTAFRLRLKKPDGTFVTFRNGESTLRFSTSTSWVRLAGQFDAVANGIGATAAYRMTVVVGAEYAGGVEETSLPLTLLVVDERSAPIARGWTLAGVQRLYVQADGSALITEGDGSAVFFAKVGGGFTSPAGEFSELAPAGTEWVRTYPDGTAVWFRPDGRMRNVVDRFNNNTQFLYDTSGRLTTIRDPNLQDLVLAYGSYGLASIRDNVGTFRFTTVTVPSNRTLTAIQDPDGVSTTFGYDASLRLQTITERRGYTTTLAYDAQSGKLASVSAPPTNIFGLGTVATVTTFAAWQKVGVPYGATSGTPFSAVTPSQVKGAITDPGGHATSFTVNKWGQPLVTTDALGRTTTASYDGNGLPTSIAYPSGGTDQFSYNTDGLPTLVQPAGQTATNIRYAGWALPDSIWGTGRPGQRLFVSAGKVDSVRLGGTSASPGSVTRFSYDGRGRVWKAVDPAGHLLSQTWYLGTNGNRSKDSLPGGRVTTYGYDAYGRQTSLAQTGLPTRTTVYDVLNRVTELWDGVNGTPTRFTYDNPGGDGTSNTVLDPAGQEYVLFYNPLGWLTARRDPQLRWESYAYSRDGELKRWTNRRGQAIDFGYEALHRVVKKWGVNTQTDSLAYSTNGRVVTAIGPLSTEWQYLNLRGQPDSVSVSLAGRTYKRRYGYSAAGLLDSVFGFSGTTDPIAQRNYGWNTAQGTLTSIKYRQLTTSLGYNADLQATTTQLPNSGQVTRQFTSIHASPRAGTD